MKIFSLIFLLLSLSSFSLNAKEVVIIPSSGESFVINIEPNESFFEVFEHIQNCLLDNSQPQENEDNEIALSYKIGIPGIFAERAGPATPRNYGAPVSSTEKEYIRFIIRSLAKHNWAQLAKEESSLKRKGDKIDHIHPFRFLQCVFTDEELKVGLYAIWKKGGRIWNEYYDGLKKSLNEESDLFNLVQFTPDFANNVGINVHLILPYIQTRQWSTLIEELLNNIPRTGDPDRYGL